MARSSYVYLVTENGEPIAAFTVKWEMWAWVDRNPGDYKLLRMGDGWSGNRKRPVEMHAP